MPAFDSALDFIPYRGDFTRGILASIYTDCDRPLEEMAALYKEYYKDAALYVCER